MAETKNQQVAEKEIADIILAFEKRAQELESLVQVQAQIIGTQRKKIKKIKAKAQELQEELQNIYDHE